MRSPDGEPVVLGVDGISDSMRCTVGNMTRTYLRISAFDILVGRDQLRKLPLAIRKAILERALRGAGWYLRERRARDPIYSMPSAGWDFKGWSRSGVIAPTGLAGRRTGSR